MADSQEVKWLEEIHIPILRSCVEIGWVAEMERMLPIYKKIAVRHNRQDLLGVFSEFEEWLTEAKSHEAIHGVESLFREDHPLLVNARAYWEERYGRGATAVPSVGRSTGVPDQLGNC